MRDSRTGIDSIGRTGGSSEWWLHPHGVSTLAEQIAQDATMPDCFILVRGIQLLAEVACTRPSGNELRIKRIVHLAGEPFRHSVDITPPSLCARPSSPRACSTRGRPAVTTRRHAVT